MGFLDRFKSKYGKDKKKTAKPKHAVQVKDDKKKRFQAVGSAGGTDKKEKTDKPVDKNKKDGDKAVTKKKTGKTPNFAPKILDKPLITEKMSANPGCYAFAVHPRANRDMVKKAIKDLYGIIPVKVNIINMSGKAVRYGRTTGATKNWKKAIVTLPAGKTIEVFES